MTTAAQITTRRIKLAIVTSAPILLAAACSSYLPTCAEGNTSQACLVGAAPAGNESTGSIQPRRIASREPTASAAAPRIGQPVTVRSLASPPYTATAHRPFKPRQTVVAMRARRATTCETTGAIPCIDANRSMAARHPLSAASSVNRRTRYIVAHKVAPGETLYAIARRYGASVTAIAHSNGINNAAHIRSGASLLIPPS